MACELEVWSCSVELPAKSMLMPIDGITAPPPARMSSVVFAHAAHGASSATSSEAERVSWTLSRFSQLTRRPGCDDHRDEIPSTLSW
jgi:hypothetical protein